MKIVVASMEAWKHPRAVKIAKTLVKKGHNVRLWAAPQVKIRNRLLRAVIRYLVSMFSIAICKADLFWIENIPDIIYIPLILLRKKYIYDRRSPWALEVYTETNNRVYYKLTEIIERLVMKYASSIICVSKELAKDARKFKKPVYILPNYPDANLLNYVNRNIREEQNILPSKKIVLFIGKLSIVEGANLLPQVAKALHKENAELWIVGDGPENTIVEKIIKKYPKTVKWFGWVQYKEIPNYLAASDIGIVPRNPVPNPYRRYYTYEGIQKIAEYFLFGKPVIASGIAPSKYYLVVDPHKLGEITAKVVRGEIELPNPPKLTWEKYCEPVIEKALEDLLKFG